VIDATQIERLGKPTITVVQDRFLPAAKMHAKVLGLPHLPFFVEPAHLSAGNAERSFDTEAGPSDTAPHVSVDAELEQLVAAQIDDIVAALTQNIAVPDTARGQ
jgi:hypothetical protein